MNCCKFTIYRNPEGGCMTQNKDNQISQHIGNTILVVMMDVESGHEAEFDRWYNE